MAAAKRRGGISMGRARGAAVLVGVGLVVVASAVIWRMTARSDTPPPVVITAAAASGWVRRETRPTLDPARFVGKAALAHRVAREIPDTLDQLYCYCECDKHSGHKSLLSCYTDGHAAT
jgi:hypothetical protein